MSMKWNIILKCVNHKTNMNTSMYMRYIQFRIHYKVATTKEPVKIEMSEDNTCCGYGDKETPEHLLYTSPKAENI